MSGYLPYGGFKWLKNIDNFDVNSVRKNSSIGYILEVYFEDPDELHVLDNDYPLALENLAVPHDMRSDYCKKNCRQTWDKVGDVKKLIPNLSNKTNHILPFKNLQLYL